METPIEPIVRLRFWVQILGAEPVDVDPRNALEMIRKDTKTLSGYKVTLVTVLPEGDAGSLLALGRGHKLLVETTEPEGLTP